MSQSKQKKQSPKPGSARNYFPIVLALGGVILIGFAVWALGLGKSQSKAATEVTGAPSLKVDKEKVDLGDVKLGEWVQVSFEITNQGDQPLSFQESPYVQLAAGC